MSETIFGISVGAILNYAIPSLVTLACTAIHSKGTSIPLLSSLFSWLGITQPAAAATKQPATQQPSTQPTQQTDQFAGLPGLPGHPGLNLLVSLLGQQQQRQQQQPASSSTLSPQTAGSMIADALGGLPAEILSAVASSLTQKK